jgi:hypothetical protein
MIYFLYSANSEKLAKNSSKIQLYGGLGIGGSLSRSKISTMRFNETEVIRKYGIIFKKLNFIF